MKLFQQYLSEDYLIEARFDVLKEKYHKLVIQRMLAGGVSTEGAEISIGVVFDNIAAVDPTPNQIYVDWLIRQYLKNMSFFEDAPAIRGDLETYTRVKPRMPADQRDINRFKTYHDLRAAVIPFAATQSAREVKQSETDEFKRQITFVYQGSEGRIMIPTTKEASIFLGRGTQWCTASTTSYNYFEHYTKDGPLYVFFTKDNQKYQLHLHSQQMMDEHDIPIKWNEWLSKYGSLFKAFIHNVKLSAYDVTQLLNFDSSLLRYLAPQITPDIIAQKLEINLIWAKKFTEVGIKVTDAQISSSIDDRPGGTISNMLASPDAAYWIKFIKPAKIAEAYAANKSTIMRYAKLGKPLPAELVKRLVKMEDIQDVLSRYNNDQEKSSILASFAPAITPEMIKQFIAKNKSYLDDFVQAGYHVDQSFVPDLSKQVNQAIKNFKLSIERVDLDKPMSFDRFHSEDKRMMRFVFTDGVYTIDLPRGSWETGEHIVKYLHLKNLDRFAGAGATERVRAAVNKEVNRVAHALRGKKVMVFLTLNSEIEYVLKATGYRLSNFPVLSKIIGNAYHLVNDACSGKKAFDAGFRPSEIGNLIGMIVKQMTL